MFSAVLVCRKQVAFNPPNKVFLDTPTKAHVSVTLKKSFAFISANRRVEVGAGIPFLFGKLLWLSMRSCRLIALYPFLLQV